MSKCLPNPHKNEDFKSEIEERSEEEIRNHQTFDSFVESDKDSS